MVKLEQIFDFRKGASGVSSIRFIHTADLHLDSPFKGMTGLSTAALQTVRNSTFAAFHRLIEHAVASKPDFVVIVGDVYDGEDRSLRAQLKFQQGMERLQEAGIPVILSYGNHDHLSGNWTRFKLPPNVYECKEHVDKVTLTVRGQEVNLYGFSYPQRHIRQEMVSQFPVATERNAFHIGLLHGSQSGNETHDVYAPFTIDELLAKQYDYWALGHIHLRQHLHEDPPIVYPGNLQGRHRNEAGEKGFYEVELSKTEAAFTFVPTSAIQFAALRIPCQQLRHVNELLETIQQAIEAFLTENGPAILDLELQQFDGNSASLVEQNGEELLMEMLTEQMEGHETFVSLQRLTSVNNYRAAGEQDALVTSILAQMDSWELDEWHERLEDVYSNVRTRRYVERLTEEQVQTIRQRAEQLLLNELQAKK